MKHYPSMRAKRPTCQRCGKELPTAGRGRPRKFCSAACKQRAYEQRHNLNGTPIPHNAVVMTPERAASLRDGLFELRCAAEDVAIASKEGASGDELQELCDDLVTLARKLEELK